MDPFVLTVNHLILQTIEHVDARGFSGNLTDIIMFMATQENRFAYEANALEISDLPLIWNLPMKVLKETDMEPAGLSRHIVQMLQQSWPSSAVPIDVDGAANAARFLDQLMSS